MHSYQNWGFRWDDLRQQASLLICASDKTGEIDDWEAKVGGDPNQLDRFVLQALNKRLSNYARGIVRQKRRELSAHGPTIRPPSPSVRGAAVRRRDQR